MKFSRKKNWTNAAKFDKSRQGARDLEIYFHE